MSTISLQDAQARLPELIHQLSPTDEVLVLENSRPVARILPPKISPEVRKLGTLKGTVTYVAPDFDAPLDEFNECLE